MYQICSYSQYCDVKNAVKSMVKILFFCLSRVPEFYSGENAEHNKKVRKSQITNTCTIANRMFILFI